MSCLSPFARHSPRGIVPFCHNKGSKEQGVSFFMPRSLMQRIPFTEGWAITQEPGLPVPDDKEDDVIFEESPASPDPSSTATSVYEITASNVVSESSSIPTSGLPTPPPTVDPPVPIAALQRDGVSNPILQKFGTEKGARPPPAPSRGGTACPDPESAWQRSLAMGQIWGGGRSGGL